MAEFKIGEVNNYFSQDDANSIFKANIDDNITEDQRDKVNLILENEEVPDPYYGCKNDFKMVFGLLNEGCDKIKFDLINFRVLSLL